VAIPRALEKDRMQLLVKEAQLRNSIPVNLSRHRIALEGRSAKLFRSAEGMVSDYQSQLGLSASRLSDLSPLSVIARGYGLARGEDGSIVKSVSQVEPGDGLTVQLADGELRARVESKKRIDTFVSEL